MASWAELNDFSEYEGSIPCVLCKESSSKTIVGDHWKCSKCAHLFNQDGSEVKVQCCCEVCLKAKADKEPKGLSLEDFLKKVGELQKKITKPKKKAVKKKKKS